MRIYNYQPKVTEQPKKSAWKKIRRKFRFTFSGRKFFTWAFRLTAAGILFAALLFLYYAKDLPDPNKLLARNVSESTKIFARDGSLMYEIHGEVKRTLVGMEDINQYVKDATVAIEDKNFYNHRGISFTGIARAVWSDIRTGSRGQGGSTITQQFVKNAILTSDKSFDRKVREIILSLAIEAKFSKEDILKLYLNEIPYGRNAYGIQAAAEAYFNKPAKDLTLAEAAYLAAIPQRPTYFNPLGPNRDALDSRKNLVLASMREQNYITQAEEQEAREQDVEFQKSKTSINAPHFVLYVQDYLAKTYGEKTLEEGGLKVYTTLDPRLQKIAEDAVKAGVEKNITRNKAYNAALVAIDPKTGQVLAMVGSADYFGDVQPEGCTPGKNCLFEPNVNVALSERQPGSSFKPYAYGTAFKPEFKFAPATLLYDLKTNFGTYGGKDYIPNNYSTRFFGPISIRQALGGSLNIPAVKTMALVGEQNVIQTARDLGITSAMQDCGLALVLGGCDIKLLDHTAAMGAIANMGVKNDDTPILKIEDNNGKVLEEYKQNPQQVLDPQAAYLLIDVMADNNARTYIFGANSPLILSGGRRVAAKTGTTQDWRDGWAMGFTPSLAAGVWTGNNCGLRECYMKARSDGVVTAAPIWHQFMEEALKDTPKEDWTMPEGVKKVTVDAVSGKLPTEYTPSTKVELFASYSAPTESDDVHIGVAIDLLTGQPADALTPPERVSYKVFNVYHSERPDNPNWENPVVAWALANGGSYPQQNEGTFVPPNTTEGAIDVHIQEPSDEATVSRLPFRITVSAASINGISRVDLSVDGQFYKSVSSTPYIFDIDKNFGEGQHTLAVRAVDSTGATADTSVVVTFAMNVPITLTEPTNNGQLFFPATVTAETANAYDWVEFYYQTSSGETKLIGKSSSPLSLASKYQYSVEWAGILDPGTYRIYGTTNTGQQTPKIRVTVP